MRKKQLIIFYDSYCPLCMIEMRKLAARDGRGDIGFQDIHSVEMGSHYPSVNIQKANSVLHGMLPDGRIILGLDVTHKAWSIVGRGFMTAPLRWPLIRHVADYFYLLFARHRYTFSRLLTGRARCERCSISAGKGVACDVANSTDSFRQ